MARLFSLAAAALLCFQLIQVGHVSAASSRIVAVGDIHSDYEQALAVLQMAKIIDSNGDWIAGQDTFVQTGDNVDRGAGTINVYKLLQKLRGQASAAGGTVINLLGNHEVMNLSGDLRYVTKEDTASFGGAAARKAAWDMQTGWIGKFVYNSFNITHIQNGHTLFSHADMSIEWAQKGVDQMNALAHKVLQGKKFKEPIFTTYGPIWNRDLAKEEAGEDETCQVIRTIKETLGVNRMVSGHTAQSSGKILTLCDNSYIGIDVGITAYYGAHRAAIEIIENSDGTQTVSAIYPTGKVVLE
ncbi:hypothetical protein FBU30_005563 [Linnemannia zychae]|nr:hypothetical protein FBU30_005563 [Linnemannia zychae]